MLRTCVELYLSLRGLVEVDGREVIFDGSAQFIIIHKSCTCACTPHCIIMCFMIGVLY